MKAIIICSLIFYLFGCVSSNQKNQRINAGIMSPEQQEMTRIMPSRFEKKKTYKDWKIATGTISAEGNFVYTVATAQGGNKDQARFRAFTSAVDNLSDYLIKNGYPPNANYKSKAIEETYDYFEETNIFKVFVEVKIDINKICQK